MLKTVVIVAGPSGAGKTTLIKQMADNALPPDILSALPPGCGQFTEVNRTWIRKRYNGIDDPNLPSEMLFHYSITGVWSKGIAGHEQVGDVPKLIGNAERITILTLHIDWERLSRQQSIRTEMQQRRKTSRPVWVKYIDAPIKALERWKKGYRTLSDAQSLAECYAAWNSYLDTLRGRPNITIVDIDSLSAPGTPPVFSRRPGARTAQNEIAGGSGDAAVDR